MRLTKHSTYSVITGCNVHLRLALWTGLVNATAYIGSINTPSSCVSRRRRRLHTCRQTTHSRTCISTRGVLHQTAQHLPAIVSASLSLHRSDSGVLVSHLIIAHIGRSTGKTRNTGTRTATCLEHGGVNREWVALLYLKGKSH